MILQPIPAGGGASHLRRDLRPESNKHSGRQIRRNTLRRYMARRISQSTQSTRAEHQRFVGRAKEVKKPRGDASAGRRE